MQFSDIDFVIIGASKSATTWLQQRLQANPEVYMPDPELHFFSREYARGSDWYLSQFREDARGKMVGEKSNTYLHEPYAATRLHAHLSHAKLIVQMRNPIDRTYARYCMRFRRGEVGSDIGTYLDPRQIENSEFLAAGDYATHLQTYIDLFSREKLLLLFFEGVANDPVEQITRVYDHLGLPHQTPVLNGGGKVKDKTTAVVPVALRKKLAWMKPMARPLRGTSAFAAARGLVAREVQYPALSTDMRKRLNDYYAPSIEALERLSGQSLSHWYEPVLHPAE